MATSLQSLKLTRPFKVSWGYVEFTKTGQSGLWTLPPAKGPSSFIATWHVRVLSGLSQRTTHICCARGVEIRAEKTDGKATAHSRPVHVSALLLCSMIGWPYSQIPSFLFPPWDEWDYTGAKTNWISVGQIHYHQVNICKAHFSEIHRGKYTFVTYTCYILAFFIYKISDRGG